MIAEPVVRLRGPIVADAGLPTGAMVALIPNETTDLALDGGVPVEELHITLCFLGDAATVDSEDRQLLEGLLAQLTANCPPLTLTVWGIAEFHGGTPDACVCALVEGDGLAELHHEVQEATEILGLDGDGYDVWVPHVTLGYGIDPGLAEPLHGMQVTIGKVVAAFGEERHEYPLPGMVPDEAELPVVAVGTWDGDALSGLEFAPPTTQPRDWRGRWVPKGGFAGPGGGGEGVGGEVDPLAVGKRRADTPQWTRLAADAVLAGTPVTVKAVDVDEVLSHFADSEVPVDLTLVTADGKPNMFSAMRGNGIPRSAMPQIPPEKLHDFQDKLRAAGFTFQQERINPADISATQSELDGRKVGGMMLAMRSGKLDLNKDPLWVSSDNKALDGHHRWASAAAIAADDPIGIDIPAIKVNAPMSELLAFANDYVDKAGIPRQDVSAPSVPHASMATVDGTGAAVSGGEPEYFGMATDAADGITDEDLADLPHGDGSAFPDVDSAQASARHFD